MAKPHILQVPESLVVEHYKEPAEMATAQLKIIWFPDEIKLEKDKQDILTNMTDAERYGIAYVQKLFTLYELKAGSDYWNGRFKRIFKRPEMQRMGSVFAAVELGVHKPFYQRTNELLHLDTEEFYLAYKEDPILVERMEFIESIIKHPNDLYSLAAFSMVEGAILYSAFGFLKHFQSEGKNKIVNFVRGIDMSVRDENIHSIGGAWAFRTLKSQMKLTPEEEIELEAVIRKCADAISEHEKHINEQIFAKGAIRGITATQLHHFNDSRLNVCMEQLGYPIYKKVEYNPIGEWFYKSINGFKFNDFFSGVGNGYVRDWDEDSFEWAEYSKDEAHA